MEQEIKEEESFHTILASFLRTIETLACPAEEACEIMGYYNVAWELKDDVQRDWEGLRDNPVSILTAQQASAIDQFAGEFNKIPESILEFENTREGSLGKMQHPSWEPIRQQARVLLKVLEGVEKANKEYLYKNRPTD